MAALSSSTNFNVFLLLMFITVVQSRARRHGEPAKTLHFPQIENEDDIFVFSASPGAEHNLVRRDISASKQEGKVMSKVQDIVSMVSTIFNVTNF